MYQINQQSKFKAKDSDLGNTFRSRSPNFIFLIKFVKTYSAFYSLGQESFLSSGHPICVTVFSFLRISEKLKSNNFKVKYLLYSF